MKTSKSAVTILMRVVWRTVGAIIQRVWKEAEHLSDRLNGLCRIGIDEVSYKKGHKYLMVVVDHDTKHLVWAGAGRSKATLQEFFTELWPERCALSTDDGTWSFNLRLFEPEVGSHAFSVRAVADQTVSPPVEGTFTILPITVEGFDGVSILDISEATTSGVVFTVVGPPLGTVCVESDAGQSAEVPLNSEGKAARRIRFLTSSFYTMTFAACTGDHWGPQVQHSLFVDDPSIVFAPWGFEDADAQAEFEVSEVG